jgi:peptidoglycan/LPS O-acetylase OafA/YrhL
MGRIPYIDFLRFTASAAVVYQHVVEASNLEFLKPTLAFAPGVFGVVLFFLISGLVIPFSFPPETAWYDFAIKRVFRIYPSYWFTLAVIACLAALGFSQFTYYTHPLDFWGWTANLALLQEYTGHNALLGVAWTLPLEFAWYALFLLSTLIVGRARAVELSLASSLLICLSAAISIAFHLRLPLGRTGMVNAALFGFALYAWRTQRASARKFSIATAIFLFSVVFSQWVSFGFFKHPNITLFNGMSGWLLAAAVFLLVTLIKAWRESSFVNSAAFARAGAISYSIYLMHPIIMGVHIQILGRDWIWLTVPVGTLLVSMATFHWVERGGIALGRRLVAALPSRVPKVVKTKTPSVGGLVEADT